MKKIALITAGVLALAGLSACEGESAADTANYNLSKAAENFEVPRRIVGINLISGDVLFSVEGFCSYETVGDTIEAICLESRDPNVINRTTLGKADQVTFVSTQLEGVKVDIFRPRIIFRPESIVPNFDLSTGGNPTDTSGNN